MAKIIRCDRCQAENCQIIQVLGNDLCNGCVQALRSWIELGVPKSDRGTMWRSIVAHLHAHEHITPQELAVIAGTTERNADDALRYYKRECRLIRTAPRTYKQSTADSKNIQPTPE